MHKMEEKVGEGSLVPVAFKTARSTRPDAHPASAYYRVGRSARRRGRLRCPWTNARSRSKQRHEYRPGLGIMSNRGGLGLPARAIIRSNEREETAAIALAAATVYLSSRRSSVTLELSIYSTVGGRARDIRSDRTLHSTLNVR